MRRFGPGVLVQAGGKTLLEVPGYRFQALVTNLPPSVDALTVWRRYNGRADLENRIKEQQLCLFADQHADVELAHIRLPERTDVRFFANKSSNFTPVGGRITPFGESLPSPAGETKEYGINLWTFDERLFFRLNRYETKLATAQWTPVENRDPVKPWALDRAEVKVAGAGEAAEFRDITGSPGYDLI